MSIIPSEQGPTPREIIEAVAAMSRTPLPTMYRCAHKHAAARHFAAAALREILAMSLADIGKAMGGRHHTTMLYASRKARRDPDFAKDMESLRGLLQRIRSEESGLAPRTDGSGADRAGSGR